MISPIKPVPKSSDGGLWGALGTIAGGVAGAVAAPFTGGASIPAGLSVGGAIGGTADRLTADTPKTAHGPDPLQTAAKLDPEALRAGLVDGHNALQQDMSIPAPEKQRISETYFKPAMDALNQTISKIRGQ